jgi:hypothetical protein
MLKACVHAQDTRAGVLVPLAGGLDGPDGLFSLPGQCIQLAMRRFEENFLGSHYPSLLRHRHCDSPDGCVCDRLRLCRFLDYRGQPAKLHHHRNCVPARRRGLVLPPLAQFANVCSAARLTWRRDEAGAGRNDFADSSSGCRREKRPTGSSCAVAKQRVA